MDLNLKRPLAFFDLETTGLSTSKDRIIEISIVKANPNGSTETKTWLVNPDYPISEESTSIHGYSNDDLADKPTFKIEFFLNFIILLFFEILSIPFILSK